MSKSYFEVNFEGNYDTVSSFLKEKLSDSKTYQHSTNKLLIEVNSDDADEVLFFKNSSTGDFISKLAGVNFKYKNYSQLKLI